MSVNVTLSSTGKTYSLPSRGEVDWPALTSYLKDVAGALNNSSGSGVTGLVVNVKNYGAKGDGVTNDTTALAAARAAVLTAGVAGGALYFPSGTYVYSSTLQFGVAGTQANVRIVGDGASSILKPTGTFSGTPAIEFRNVSYWRVTDVVVDGAAYTGSADLLLIDGSSNGYAAGCTFKNSARYGVNITKINGSAASSNNVVYANTYSGNATADVSPAQDSDALIPDARVKHWYDFGMVCDGTVDDTVAFKAALKYFGDGTVSYGNGAKTGVLVLPPRGRIKITSMAEYFGDVSRSLVITSRSSGLTGSMDAATLVWGGSTGADAIMLRMVGANGCLIDNVQFEGNSNAKAMLAWDNAVVNGGSDMWGPSSYNYTEKCHFQNHGGTGCSDVRVGGVPGTQVSEVYFRDCEMFGNTAVTGFGIDIQSVANCKNFYIEDCQFNSNYVHINAVNRTTHGGSPAGNLKITDCGFSTCSGAFVTGGGNTAIVDCEAESGDGSSTYTTLVYDSGPPGNGAIGTSLLLRNLQCTADWPAADKLYPANASDPTDITKNADIAIRCTGKSTIIGCEFTSLKSGLTFPKIAGGPTSDFGGVTAGGSGGSLTSIANWYQLASGAVPVYDGSGNALTGAAAGFGNTIPDVAITSLGDLGGDGTTPLGLNILFGTPPVVPHFQPSSSSVASKIVYSGQSRRVQAQWSLIKTDFSAAATTKAISLAIFLPRTRIYSVRVKGVAFAGITGPVTFSLGLGPTGNEVFSSKTVSGAAFDYGVAAGDYTLGAFGTSDNLLFGYPLEGAGPFEFYLQVASASGNLSGLSAGTMEITFDYLVPV